MKTTITLLLFVSIAAAQDTEAERLFRDAWWKETGVNDLEAARKLYEQAAEAAGPSPIRAKALLRVAEVYYRLGKTEVALQRIKRIAEAFPDEKDVAAEAKLRLREWTAVDLRESFDDYYDRYKMGSAYQAQIAGLIEELAAASAWQTRNAIESKLLAAGRAAIPALRDAHRSTNTALAERAIGLLIRLGDIPDPRLLVQHDGWSDGEDVWIALLRLPAADRRKLASTPGGTPLARLLRATAQQPDALLDALCGVTGAELGEACDAIGVALHRLGIPELQTQLAQRAVDPETPLRVRDALESVVCEYGWAGAEATAWLDWGEKAGRWDAKRVAVTSACRRLRSHDAGAMDRLLAGLAAFNEWQVESMNEAIQDGLEQNPVLLTLPWTAERLRTWLRHAARTSEQLLRTLGRLRRDPRTVAIAMEALLADPIATLSWRGEFEWYEHFTPGDLSDADRVLVEQRWARAAGRAAHDRWGGWSAEQRHAFAGLLPRLVAIPRSLPKEFLRRIAAEAADEKNPEELRQLLAGVLEKATVKR